MDTQINIVGLARALYRRGTHRLLGNPFLGSLAAFLTVLFLIRIAADVYLAVDLSVKGSNIDAVQIASALLVILSAYALWVGSLASLRTGFALPALSFVDLAPYGKRFRSRFIRRIAFQRPMNLTTISTMLATTLATTAVFSMAGGDWRVIALRALVVLCCTFVGVAIVIAVASRFPPSQSEIRILELLYLLLVVALNPDVGSFNDRVSIFFVGIHYSFSSLWTVGFAGGLTVIFAVLVLLLVRALSFVSNALRRQSSGKPMQRWYWRFVRIRSWVFLYMLAIPLLISSTSTASTKRWTLVLTVLFGVASYLYFIAHCENTLNEKWRSSLFDKGNTRLAAGSALVHIGLMMVPLVGYVAAR
jgi:hypothetical protein